VGTISRTLLAETFAAAFASTPLADECVFLSPKRLDGTIEREVCDLMLVLRKEAILIQMKCQEDPLARTGGKLERWVKKQSKAGLSQLQGAIGTITESEIWSDHPSRGRVTFSKGEFSSVYGVVLTEHFDTSFSLETDFPLAHKGVPISYFTVNDFLNVVFELRALPEILCYLNSRRNIPTEAILRVGGESVLFEHYVLNDRSFDGWTTYDEISRILASLRPQLRKAMEAKREADAPAYEVEKLVSGLASSVEIRALGIRESHLKIQEELLDLPLVERRKLGSQLLYVREKVRGSSAPSCLAHAVAWFDSKPNFLYVCASSRGVDRDRLMTYGQSLLQGGLAFYGKTSGITALERENGNYLWFYIPDFASSDDARALGERLFGSLRVADSVETLIPPH
jgi:hypothetical protein